MPGKNRHVDVLRAAWRLLPEPQRHKLRPVARKVLPPTLKPSEGAAKPRPLLSIVVPVYNVEEYLDECLASITAQKVAGLEIIVVDDGSSDGSMAIVERYANSDPRVFVIRQPNAGLGAARNTGIRHASATFLGFADSDDIVPPGAYSTLVGNLKRSGSDFVTGSIVRLAGDRKRPKAWSEDVHAKRRIGIVIADFPQALQDVFAWNKLFRRQFWDTQVGSFPEGILYEDQETSTKAYLRATSFDVLPDVVYEWRIRPDRSSITQQKHDINDLRDRLTVIGHTRILLNAEAGSEVKSYWLAKILGRDLAYYYVQVPRVDEGYWNLLQDGVRELAEAADSSVWRLMEMRQRVLVYLIAGGHRRDTERFLTDGAEHGPTFPVQRIGGILKAESASVEALETPIPEELLVVAENSLRLLSRLTAVRSGSNGQTVEIEGHAYVPGIDASIESSILTVFLRSADRSTAIELETTRFNDPSIDWNTASSWNSYAESAFRATLDVDTLEHSAGSDSSAREHDWFIDISLHTAGTTVISPFKSRDRSGAAASLPVVDSSHGTGYVCRFEDPKGLVFSRIQRALTATEVRLEGRRLTLTVVAPDGESVESLTADCPSHKVTTTVMTSSGSPETQLVIDLPKLPARQTDETPAKTSPWRFRARSSSGTLHHLVSSHLSGQPWFPQGSLLRITTNGAGHLEIRESAVNVMADFVELDVNRNTVIVQGQVGKHNGSQRESNLQTMSLAGPDQSIPATRFEQDDNGAFVAEFPLGHLSWGRTVEAPKTGNYVARYYLEGDAAVADGYAVTVPDAYGAKLPWEALTDSVTLRVQRSPVAANLVVYFGPALNGAERGKFHQNQLRSTVTGSVSAEFETAVLFETFNGKSATDSGLEIFRELVRRDTDLFMYWSVSDHSVAVPSGAQKVVQYSRQWYELLQSAGYLVNNGLFHAAFRKNSHQTYIQTWHGTPLKRIGYDGPTTHMTLPHLASLNRERSYWDLLVTQNDYARDVLSTALDYPGEVLVAGYPRNDSLHGQEVWSRRQAVRELIGIPDGKTAILYAPTWRDHVTDFKKPHGYIDYLNLNLMHQRLGEDHVLLLRNHPDMTGERPRPPGFFGFDVTSYPDISDLYLAADLLVADYSSIAFDFCNTGKPMYFFAPDLDLVRDGPRGFYLDYEAVVPGPVLRSTDELIAAIHRGTGSYHADYEAFKSKFSGLDDGSAAARVVDRVWGSAYPRATSHLHASQFPKA